MEYDVDSTPGELEDYCSRADFVFNLAGVNRPEDQSEFMEGNFGFASTLLDALERHGNTCPVMLSSSAQYPKNRVSYTLSVSRLVPLARDIHTHTWACISVGKPG